MFGLLKKKASAEALARTITAYAINPGACMQMVAMMRGYPVDDEVLIAEISLLRASYVRGIFRRRCPGSVFGKMADAALATVMDSFKSLGGMNSESLRRFYDGQTLTQVVKSRMDDYAAKEDAPALTCADFCARLRAPSIMSNVEVQKMLADFLGSHVEKALGSVKAV
jgi:hypothetical protein